MTFNEAKMTFSEEIQKSTCIKELIAEQVPTGVIQGSWVYVKAYENESPRSNFNPWSRFNMWINNMKG